MPQVGIFPWSRPMPHTHESLGQGGKLSKYSSVFNNLDTIANILSNHSKAIHDALHLAHGELTVDCVFRAWLNVEQDIINSTTTKVLFDSEDYDIGGNFDADGVDSNFIAPSTGYYLITSTLRFMESFGANQEARMYIYVNDFPVVQVNSRSFAAGMMVNTLSVIGIHHLAVNDDVDIRIWHLAGENRKIIGTTRETFLHISKFGV